MNLQRTQILRGPTGNINGTEIRPLLAGDSAYSLMNWLVKPYPDRGRLTQEQRKFKMESTRKSRTIYLSWTKIEYQNNLNPFALFSTLNKR